MPVPTWDQLPWKHTTYWVMCTMRARYGMVFMQYRPVGYKPPLLRKPWPMNLQDRPDYISFNWRRIQKDLSPFEQARQMKDLYCPLDAYCLLLQKLEELNAPERSPLAGGCLP